MSPIKIGLLIVLIAFIAIQFIQPARNQSGQDAPTNISRIYKMPDRVNAILITSCYDCHSNNTNYPWYAKIQPSGWWMASHIKKGKSELNFSEFGNYSKRKRKSKLKSIAISIEDATMPLPAYTLIHKNANLTKDDKAILLSWVKKTRDSLSLKN